MCTVVAHSYFFFMAHILFVWNFVDSYNVFDEVFSLICYYNFILLLSF